MEFAILLLAFRLSVAQENDRMTRFIINIVRVAKSSVPICAFIVAYVMLLCDNSDGNHIWKRQRIAAEWSQGQIAPHRSTVACIRKAILIEYEMGRTWYVNGAGINTANRLQIFTCYCHHFLLLNIQCQTQTERKSIEFNELFTFSVQCELNESARKRPQYSVDSIRTSGAGKATSISGRHRRCLHSDFDFVSKFSQSHYTLLRVQYSP